MVVIVLIIVGSKGESREYIYQRLYLDILQYLVVSVTSVCTKYMMV